MLDSRHVLDPQFAHAMGNSTGNLAEWYAEFREARHGQGGFIWDWCDQGLYRYDPNSGRRYFVYGGDFGEAVHDLQFNM